MESFISLLFYSPEANSSTVNLSAAEKRGAKGEEGILSLECYYLGLDSFSLMRIGTHACCVLKSHKTIITCE